MHNTQLIMWDIAWVQYLPTVKGFVTVGALVLLWALEWLFPFFGQRKGTLWHNGRNLVFGVINGLIVFLGIAWLTEGVNQVDELPYWGILVLLPLPLWAHITLGIILFDLWMYIWHRANHHFSILWRFHRMHHSDPMLCATSAFRFHTGEIIISSSLRIGVILILGLAPWQVLLYETILMPVIFLHHSNYKLPERVDRFLRVILVTPSIHRVHHSRRQTETNSNYASIFSWWDRICRSLIFRKDIHTVQYGLNNFDDEYSLSLRGMILTPLR
jgi:sterol desaturase/sphingolipid hydroxylase (fatty acid hydroxylase superfamily)